MFLLFIKTSSILSPSKSSFPVKILKKIAPQEKMSDFKPYPFSVMFITSGATYPGDPHGILKTSFEFLN